MNRSLLVSRRELLSLMAAGGVPVALPAQEKPADLQRLTTSPVTVEFPGREPQLLKPDPARLVYGTPASRAV